MKKLISLLLVLMLCVGAACAETTEAVSCYAEGPVPGNGLGFEILRELSDGEQNLVVSPLSLAYAMSMAALGAEGETQQEMLDALGVESVEAVAALQEALAESGLRQANAAFVAGEMTAKDAYIQELAEQFGAKWFENEGDVAQNVNEWVEDVTDGMIEKLLEGELSEDIMLVLVNAIAMEAKWASPFAADATYDDVFHAPGGDVTVPFMHKEFWADYAERDGVQMLRMDYQDCGLDLLIAMPEEGGIPAVLEGLCQDGLSYFQFGDENSRVNLAMPKVDISAGCTLNDALQALGVGTAFSDEADFSGITEDMPLKLDSVIQKARLIFDEEGTRAAAATAMMVTTMALIDPSTVVEFSMDRPFVIVIADETTGAVCFAGVVADPAGN